MDELKPCPFCGSEAQIISCGKEWYVECSRNPFVCYCKPWTGYIDTKEYAIELWNRRAEDGKDD